MKPSSRLQAWWLRLFTTTEEEELEDKHEIEQKIARLEERLRLVQQRVEMRNER